MPLLASIPFTARLSNPRSSRGNLMGSQPPYSWLIPFLFYTLRTFLPSSMWSKLTQIFSSQWGKDTVRLVEGDEASDMIKRAEAILEDSMRVLASHERVLSEGEFNIFSIKHRQLVLKVVEVKQQAHEQQTRSILTASPAGRDSDRIDRNVFRVFRQTQIYHQDLLTASRRAQIEEEERFFQSLDEESTQSGSSDPMTTWYSVISSKSPTESDSSSDSTTLVNREPYLAVAHVRAKKPEAADPEGSSDDESYRQILILESKDKTMIMINPNRCYLNEDYNPLNESSLLEMSRAGEALLQATDPNNLQGYEVVRNAQDETSWVDSSLLGAC
ncbi:hypothetical protein B0J17DRAFT_721693 [Rhizoctonia solani]|nr:hypothetical protein B0J17DRAFT_721693 [Rhizoctonia solani]